MHKHIHTHHKHKDYSYWFYGGNYGGYGHGTSYREFFMHDFFIF